MKIEMTVEEFNGVVIEPRKELEALKEDLRLGRRDHTKMCDKFYDAEEKILELEHQIRELKEGKKIPILDETQVRVLLTLRRPEHEAHGDENDPRDPSSWRERSQGSLRELRLSAARGARRQLVLRIRE